ncbi:MAG: NAD(P)/FAD-dependent oxidoreductase [Bacteroidota bacterium]
MTPRIDIIGGGASGLACAHELSLADFPLEIHLWESESQLGGLAGSFETPHFRVEKFYHHIFKRDEAIQQLIREMDLESELVWQAAATGSYYFSQPYRLSAPLDLLRFKPLPFLDRIRMGLLVLHARTVKDWRKLDDTTVKDYIVRIAGKKVYEVVWEPLLKGKFGPYAESVSAAWLWCKLVDRGGSRNAQGFEYLAYLKGGMGRLFEAVGKELERKGHHIHRGERIQGLLTEGDQVTAIQTEQATHPTNWVIAANQVPDLVSLLPQAQAAYQEQLDRIGFLGNVCLVWSLDQSLSEFYWTNVTDPSAPFVGVVEQSKWTGTQEFDGQHLVYLSAYVPPGDDRMTLSAEALTERYLPFVQKMFPHFQPDSILDQWVWRAEYAQPVVTVGYRHLVPAEQSPLKNLFLCTMAQIYPNDRQVSNGIGRGRALAKQLITKISPHLTPAP